MVEDQIDCIVQIHDAARLQELNRRIFSLVGQTYRPLSIILVTPQLPDEEIESIHQSLSPFMSLPGAPILKIISRQHKESSNAEVELLNFGLNACTGRYVCFLDYGNILYPEACELLVNRLKKTQAAIVFSSMRSMSVDVHKDFVYVRSQATSASFCGEGLRNFLAANFDFAYFHLIDRSKLAPDYLRFDERLTIEKSYAVLLKICAIFNSDFHLLKIMTGDHQLESNADNAANNPGDASSERKNEREKDLAIIENIRRTTIISPAVRKALGLWFSEINLSVHAALNRFSITKPSLQNLRFLPIVKRLQQWNRQRTSRRRMKT
jgi:hypothetical protein